MDFLSGAATDNILSSPAFLSSVTPLFNSDTVPNLIGSGTSITVNSIADVVDDFDNVTTLREAINFANLDATEDLIIFDSSLFATQQTISLSLGQLSITHNLSIKAPQDELTLENLVTVSGNNASRVFEIETGATVNLSGLIVADGDVIDDKGGGIKNSGTLTLDHSIVRNNTLDLSLPTINSAGLNFMTGVFPTKPITANEYGGGGIYNMGILKVSNSTLSGNKATFSNRFNSTNLLTNTVFGGGIYNTGTLEVSNSTLTRNGSGRANISVGGGIYNSVGGIVKLSNSTLDNNVAGGGDLGAGAGIYNDGTLTVSNSTVDSNRASGRPFAAAGGIYNTGTLKVSNSTLNNNSGIANFSVPGGGIYNTGILEVSNSTFDGNSAKEGGGIYNLGTLTVSNSTLKGNSAQDRFPSSFINGGGIYNRGNLTVSNSTISGNSASNAEGRIFDGGGIFNSNTGNLTVSNSTISSNSARYGGGISNYGTLKVSNSTLSANSAVGSSKNGGGIYNSYGGILTLMFSTLTLNSAANGGGIYQDNVPSPLFSSQSLGSNSVRNTIIALNFNSVDGINPDVAGNFTSDGYNLIGDGTGSTGFDATRDIVGTTDNPIDPILAPLDFYGGSTQTIALLPDSPAIDAGDPIILDTDPTTDQRGYPRKSGDRADIGAFEFFEYGDRSHRFFST